MKISKHKIAVKRIVAIVFTSIAFAISLVSFLPAIVSAQSINNNFPQAPTLFAVVPCSDNGPCTDEDPDEAAKNQGYTIGGVEGKHQCGSGDGKQKVSINFGCAGEACITNPAATYCAGNHSALTDLAFAFIRFLSAGVGIVIVGSVVWAGIQYTMSKGDPQATAEATKRIQSNLIALLIFIFAYAILNFLIPNGFFNQ